MAKKATLALGAAAVGVGVRQVRRRRRLRDLARAAVEGAATDVGIPVENEATAERIEPIPVTDEAHAPGHAHLGPPPAERPTRGLRRDSRRFRPGATEPGRG